MAIPFLFGTCRLAKQCCHTAKDSQNAGSPFSNRRGHKGCLFGTLRPVALRFGEVLRKASKDIGKTGGNSG
jgi:hypothetical protein